MAFNDAAISAVFNKIVSYALASGRFDSVNQHEPKSAPGSGLSCSIWVQNIRPITSSGLAMTSGVVEINARIYTSFISEPFDAIDPSVMAATSDIMGALSGDFSFGGSANVRCVDLLGMEGTALSSQAGYVELDRKMYRVMTILIPVIINDMWLQSGVVTTGPADVNTLTVDNLVVNQDVTIGDDLTVGDDVAITGDLTVSGALNFPNAVGDYWAGQSLSPGESSLPRIGVGTSANLVSGTMILSYWTAIKTETCTKIAAQTQSTAAGATPTYCALGVYSVAANGDLTLQAQCANDTTLFATSFTYYLRNLISSFSKVKGQRYAFAGLVVSAAAMPNLAGLNGTVVHANTASATPRIGGVLAGQSSLPVSISSASVGNSSSAYYGEVIP